MSFRPRAFWIVLVLAVIAAATVVYVPAGRGAVLEARGGAATQLAPGFHLRRDAVFRATQVAPTIAALLDTPPPAAALDTPAIEHE